MARESLETLRESLGAEDQAYQAAVADFDAAAARLLGVNGTDLRCLEILLTHHRQALPSQLGAMLGLTTGSVTMVLDRLERKGYVTRSPDPGDRRKVIVQATSKAFREVLEEIYAPLAEEGVAGLADYTAADLSLVIDFLRRGRELYERHLDRIRSLPRRTT